MTKGNDDTRNSTNILPTFTRGQADGVALLPKALFIPLITVPTIIVFDNET